MKKIYTYHQEVSDSRERLYKEMIKAWKKSWKQKGFEPIVLGLKDAKRHPYYEEFEKRIRSAAKKVQEKPTSIYGISCWLRWLAYATQKDEYFYVSDYDVLNNNFSVDTEFEKELHLMGGCCPFFASGKPQQFYNLCKLFVELTLKRSEEIIAIKNQWNEKISNGGLSFRHYHDQEFFVLNLQNKSNSNAERIKKDNDIKITKNLNVANKFLGFHEKNAQVVHFSGYCLDQLAKNHGNRYFSRGGVMTEFANR